MRLFTLLLHLYPRSFRIDYGDDMRAIFAARQRDATTIGARILLSASMTADTITNAGRVHWDILRQDLRYSFRTLSRTPGFALTAIVIAALGIGATTAAFSIADHVLIRPLPFADAERLVKLWERTPAHATMELSPPNFRDWKAMSRSFEAMAAYRGLSVTLDEGNPERIEGASMTADLLPMLGAEAMVGRTFRPEDDTEGAERTVVLSDGLWRARFGGDPAVVGRTVLLDDQPYTIVGVMPPGFRFPWRDAELWTAMRFSTGDFEDRDNNHLHVVAKLKPDVSIEQARAELGAVAAALERAFPQENAETRATVNFLRDEVSQQSRLALMVLVGASGCMLLIACTNLANLLLARALGRERELAVRAALGAGRERLWRQIFTEHAVLAGCGGLAGVMLAIWVMPIASRLAPTSLPIAATPHVDHRVLALAALITCATALGCGIVPALRLSSHGRRGAASLHGGSRVVSGRATERLRSVLVIAEVTAAVVLVIASGLLIRALWRVRDIDPGFRPDRVLTLRTSLPLPKYQQLDRRAQFYSQVLSDVRALPGVTHAGYISFLPMTLRGGIWPVSIDGRPADRGGPNVASLRFVTPGLFATLGIPLRLGRDVTESDTDDSLLVAVVSESFVQHYFPSGDPMGRRFHFGLRERTIVGVVGNVSVRGLERKSEPQVYLPYRQVADDGFAVWYAPKDLAIKTSGDPSALMPAVRAIIARVDPRQSISDIRPLTEIVDRETAARSVQVRVLGGFASLAVLLAGIGIYGVLAFSVSKQSREIGVRLALGAQRRDILLMVLRRALRWGVAGIAIGVALAYATGRILQALLAGVSPADPATFALAIVISLVMATIGGLLPAVRAVRVSPLIAIRTE